MLLAVCAAAQSPSANGPVRLTGKVVVRSFDVAKYPAAAQNQKIQGRVVLDVVVSPKGKVERTEPISGDPLLATAVSDISKKWSFEPYNQNGQPVEFVTRIGMDFILIDDVVDKKLEPYVEAADPTSDLPVSPGATPDQIKLNPALMAGHLVNKVPPVYPPAARSNRMQGTVRLHAIIGKDGHIKNLTILEGHPMLTQSAFSAVKQWRYAPYMRDGQPVEVETTITVAYHLGG
jgi:TonB family protein